MGPFLATVIVAVALTEWQVQVDRSVFERFFGALDPIGVMTGIAVVGVISMAYLQGTSDFAVLGPGAWRDVVSIIAWAVPLLEAAAIGVDLVLGYGEDTNVAMPDALRFYPAIAVFVEIAFHAVPIAVLVAILGMPTGHRTGSTLTRLHTHSQHRKSLLDKPTLFRDADLSRV